MLTDGSPVPEDGSHTVIDPHTGQQRGYIVLTPEERAKGFIKPVRRSYRHRGPPTLPLNLRDLTEEEKKRNDPRWGYAKFEPYGPERLPLTGKYWTQPEIDRVGKYCGAVTTMSVAIAETYARQPDFYNGTYCVGCRTHFPLNEFTWEPDGEPMDVSLQEDWHKNREQREREEADRTRAARMAAWEERKRALREELVRLEAERPK
jgi:hypothetical protein